MPYVQLTSQERYVIYYLKLYKPSLRETARRLGRHHSTISREIRHNGPVVPTWVYWQEGGNYRGQTELTRVSQTPPVVLSTLKSVRETRVSSGSY